MGQILRWPSSAVRMQALVITGTSADQPNLRLTARVGNNGSGGDDEIVLESFNGTLPADTEVATSTWDPLYGTEPLTEFISYFQLRLVVDAQTLTCRASVGTMPFVQVGAEPFTAIEMVRLGASVPNTTSQREVSWESATVLFRYQDGFEEKLVLDALPRAVSPQMFRLPLGQVIDAATLPRIEHSAELNGNNLVGFTVVGLIKFSANEPPAPKGLLGSEDLKVTVAVFTNAAAQAPPQPVFARQRTALRRTQT